METNTKLLTPRNQLQNHLALMSDCENNAVLAHIKAGRDLGELDSDSIMNKVVNAVQFIFFTEAVFSSSKYREDSAGCIEEMINKFTPQFLSFVVKLEFGTVNFGPTIGILKRLPANFGKLRNLRKLYLNGQPIEDFEPLRNLELDFLCAEGCPVTDPTPVSLNRLSWFNIDQTKIENIEYLKDSELIMMQKVPGQLNESKIDVMLKMPNLNIFCVNRNEQKNLPESLGCFKYDESGGTYEIDDPKERKIRMERARQIGSKIIDYHYMDIL